MNSSARIFGGWAETGSLEVLAHSESITRLSRSKEFFFVSLVDDLNRAENAIFNVRRGPVIASSAATRAIRRRLIGLDGAGGGRRWKYMETDDRGRRGRLDDGRERMSGLEGRCHVVT